MVPDKGQFSLLVVERAKKKKKIPARADSSNYLARAEPKYAFKNIWLELKRAKVVPVFHENSKNNLIRTICTYMEILFFSFLESQFHLLLCKKFSSFWLADPRADDNLARAKTS